MSTATAIKRIHRDIREYQTNSLNDHGIFCVFDEENALHVRALVIGGEDTPYNYGFFFFDLHFPTTYPFAPPKVTYETRHGGIRFHPNLYANSKVCLSMLGTWAGPGWTSAQTLCSTLLTIQSLLDKDPLTNEPGWEVRTPHTEKKHDLYEEIVSYENMRTAIFRMMQDPPKGFEAFLPIMNECFKVNAAAIGKQLTTSFQKDPSATLMRCGVYCFETIVDYASCLSLFEETTAALGVYVGASEADVVMVDDAEDDDEDDDDDDDDDDEDDDDDDDVDMSSAMTISNPVSNPVVVVVPATPQADVDMSSALTISNPVSNSIVVVVPATPTPTPTPTPNASTTSPALQQQPPPQLTTTEHVIQPQQQPSPVKAKKKTIKRPSQKALSMEGQIVAVVQPDGATLTFESRKCKRTDLTKPEKYQWRRLK